MSTTTNNEVTLVDGKGTRGKVISKVDIVDKFTDWENEPSLAELRVDYENALPYHNEYVQKLNGWVVTTDGGVVPKKIAGKSNYRSKVVRKQYEWSYPLVEEPLLNTPNIFNITATTTASLTNENTNAELLNYQWNTDIDKLELINEASRAFVNEGTAIVKLGWKFDFTEVEEVIEENVYAETNAEILEAINDLRNGQGYSFTDQQLHDIANKELMIKTGTHKVKANRIDVHSNHPTYTVVDNESLIIDPKCKGRKSNINFVVEEIEVGFNTLRENEFRKIEFITPEGNKSSVEVGHYYNLNVLEEYISSNIIYNKKELRENETAINTFEFEDKARQKVIMFEYWGFYDINGTGKLEPIVASWVEDTLIRLEKNPYAHGEIPYSFAKFMPVRNSMHGEPNAELLKNDQDAISSITRGMQDIGARGAVGQTWVNEQMFYNTTQRSNFKNGDTVYYKGDLHPRDAVYREKPEDVPMSMYKMAESHQKEAEQMTGTIAYNHGNPNARGSGISSNKTEDDATTQREMGILRRFTSMVQDLGRKTVLLNQEYITDDTVIRLTGKKENFRVINEKDLKGNFNIAVTISTPQKNDATANKIFTMMQTNAASMHPKLADLHYIKIAKLWNQDDLADSIKEFSEQPPSEAEQRMQQMDMEMKELELKRTRMQLLIDATKVQTESNRFSEQAIDALTSSNNANAEYRMAQAEKLKSQTALFDQELDYISSGLRMKEEVLHHEYQHAANLEREDIRTKRELANIAEKEGRKPNTEDTKQINHSVTESAKVIDSTLNTESADGSEDKFEGIRQNNNTDLLDEIAKV